MAAFLVWRLAQAAVFAGCGGSVHQLFAWDGRWYRGILRDGYTSKPSTAFFPLLPWSARAVRVIVPSDLGAAIVISTVAGLAAVIALHAVTRTWKGDAVARAAVVLLLLFPTSVFLWLFYTEALFIALSAGALLAQERGRPAVAGILAAGAAMTRVPGVLVVVGLLARHRQGGRRVDRSVLWYGLGLVGLAVVMVVQAAQAGGPLSFLDAGRAWGREASLPWMSMVGALRALPRHDLDVALPIDLLAAALFVGLAVLAFRRPWPWSARALLVLLVAVPLCSGMMTSVSRYVLAAWPGFAVAAERWAELSRRTRVAITVGLLVVSVATVTAFAHGRFVG